jgi:hypothetical protein
MATFDLRSGTGNAYPAFKGGMQVLDKEIDFSKTPFANLDVLRLINIPAKTLVFAVGWDVVVAQGSAATGSLGDSSSGTGWSNGGVNANSAVGACTWPFALTEGTPNTITGQSAGKFYASADDLRFTLAAALTLAKIRFFAVTVRLNFDS